MVADNEETQLEMEAMVWEDNETFTDKQVAEQMVEAEF